MINKTIYVDMDDVLCNFTKAIKEQRHTLKFPQAKFDFFRNLEPIENAIDSYLYLHNNFHTYILTAPSIYNPMSYTEKRVWVEKYFGIDIVNNLIICSHKNLLIGDYLIDDNNKGKGQNLFQGKLIHFGKLQFKSWDLVINYFKKEYNL